MANIHISFEKIDIRNDISSISSDSNMLTSKRSLEDIRNPIQILSDNFYKEKYQKLSQAVLLMFLSIKRMFTKGDSCCAHTLKEYMPLQENDEASAQRDPLLLVEYLKNIYEKTVETKIEGRKPIDNRDEGLSVYEPFLQKLEAEVRRHIQIQQQMKIHIENLTERLKELEVSKVNFCENSNVKEGSQHTNCMKMMDENNDKIEELETENAKLREDVRKFQIEVKELKKGLINITDIAKRLAT